METKETKFELIDLDNSCRSDKSEEPGIKTMPGKRRSTLFGSISLLLWKNFLIRRRHYLNTALEILLPTFFAVVIAAFKSMAPEIQSVQTNINTTFSDLPESKLARMLMTGRERRSKVNFIIGYAPAGNMTDEIMQTFEQSIFKHSAYTNLQIKGFPSEEEVVHFNAYGGLHSKEGHRKEALRAAIIFDQGFSSSKDALHSTNRKLLAYRIRLVDIHIDTNRIYDVIRFPGPIVSNAGKVYQDPRGSFAALQIFMDKAITEVVTGKKLNYTMSVQAFPYPPYESKVDFSSLLTPVLPIFLVAGFIFIVPSVLRKVVSEKESGIKELMKMMGLRSYQHWIGWMLDSLLMIAISITIVTSLLFSRFASDGSPYLVHSDPSVWWAMMVVYALSAVSCLFFISTLFQNAIIAVSVGMVFWIVSYISMAVPLLRHYENLSLFVKMMSCLLPNMALHWSVKLMHGLEYQGFGATWGTLGKPLNSLDTFCVGHVLLMELMSSVLYICLTLYLECILPSKYGLTKPWNFIFKASFWRKRRTDSGAQVDMSSSKETRRPGFESEPTNLRRSVEIQNLKKYFQWKGQTKHAVDGLSLNMYEGQITVLLGCNGAGKTTLISMLTGLFSPTAGTACIYDRDISQDMDSIRSQLGYCSQHNILFELLTVQETLLFFARLKGMSRKDANAEIKTLLNKLELTEKRNSLTKYLSGGQKRKVSLAMAVIGGSKLVIMDEPTAGMDPEARRNVWDLLLEVRKTRSMLLTTHFMEEADILGDRVAVVSAGKIHCCGSTLFLKQYYGSGCTLKMSVLNNPKSSNNNNCDMIFGVVKKFVPRAYWQEGIDENNPNEIVDISIVLPRNADGVNDTSQFPAMFAELTCNKAALGILHIGLPLTTMDEVFAKVADETGDMDLTGGAKDKRKGSEVVCVNDAPEKNVKVTGLYAVWTTFQGLLIKRIIYTSRKKLLFATQLLLPVILTIASIWVFNSQIAPVPSLPPLKIELGTYNNPKTVYATTNSTHHLGSIYQRLVTLNPSGADAAAVPTRENQALNDALIELAKKDELVYRERYIAAADFKPTHVRAMFQTIPNHASPLAINLVSNTMLRSLMPPQEEDITLTITNHPLKSGLNYLLEACTLNPQADGNLPLIFALLLPLGLSTLAAGFIVFPLEERLCKAKHLQLMTGTNVIVYWMSSFAWDLFVVLVLAVTMVLFFPVAQTYSAFTWDGAIGAFFLIMVVFGVSAISFSYLCSLFMPSVAGGFAFQTVLNMFVGMLWSILVHIVEQSNFFDLAKKLRWAGRLFPSFGASQSLMRFVDKVRQNVRCNLVTDEVKAILCNKNNTNYDHRLSVEEFQSCCDNCKDFSDRSVSCFERRPYLEWEGPAESDHIPRSEILPGIGQELVCMLGMALIYQLTLYAIELWRIHGPDLLQMAWNAIDKTEFPSPSTDEDVQRESKRVREGLVSKGGAGKDAIVVHDLCKRFGRLAAVSNMNFGVHRGECYGLLGVNGAGKTTLFQMLTGGLNPSGGSVQVGSSSLASDKKSYLEQIGYCPQHEGLLSCLSGRETLELFCRLRGIHPKNVGAEAGKWLQSYGLSPAANVQCGSYSGGMKRRLSAAIAMVGRPDVILLDEPTSGVDPVSRRQFWDLVKAGKDGGQALILTSHSMEECEALCSRLSIMVNGQLRCTGTVQHLKSKLTQGFTLIFKLSQSLVPEEREAGARDLIQEIENAFSPCTLMEQHENVIQYRVERKELIWEPVFRTVEELKTKFSHIVEDYSVTESSLDEIFLSIARTKDSSRTVKQGRVRQYFCKLFWCPHSH